MRGRVLIRYVDGTYADASRSKLLSKEAVENLFNIPGYRLTFTPDGASVQKGRAKAFKAPLGTVYRKYYYNFTGMRFPRFERLSVEISSENPELLDRVFETLDRADNIFDIDDAGHHHRGRMEILEHSGAEPRTLTGWVSLPDENDPVTPNPVQSTYVYVAEVSAEEAAAGGPSALYLARTEAGMWRKVREGEGIPPRHVGPNDIEWLHKNGRRMQWSERELFD